ncbi:MAG: hypothetical protein ACI4XM_03500 [Candidatus Coprovivens sp.]
MYKSEYEKAISQSGSWEVLLRTMYNNYIITIEEQPKKLFEIC